MTQVGQHIPPQRRRATEVEVHQGLSSADRCKVPRAGRNHRHGDIEESSTLLDFWHPYSEPRIFSMVSISFCCEAMIERAISIAGVNWPLSTSVCAIATAPR